MENSDNSDSEGGALELWQGTVVQEWLDYNGHMTEFRYLQIFGETSDKFYELIGVDFAQAEEGAFYTSETHIRHLVEAKLGTKLHTRTDLLGFDTKRVHILHYLYNAERRLLATGEHLAVYVCKSATSVMPKRLLTSIESCFSNRANFAPPSWTGSVLRKPLGTI